LEIMEKIFINNEIWGGEKSFLVVEYTEIEKENFSFRCKKDEKYS